MKYQKIPKGSKWPNELGKDVWVFEQHGYYWGMTLDQVREMHRLCAEIIEEIDKPG